MINVFKFNDHKLKFKLIILGNYTPGVVTDLIREVRDASRVRDESLFNKVRALIDEKSWTLNETNLRVLREMEEIKVCL